MKLYIHSPTVPWVTWDKDLWKAMNDDRAPKGFHIVTSQADADIEMYEYGYESPSFTKPTIAYVESLEYDEIDQFALTMRATNTLVLTDSFPLYNTLRAINGLNVDLWNKPSRVPAKLLYAGPEDIAKKSGGFVVTCNGQRTKDNFVEVLRTYFAMCLKDGKDGELELMEDLRIFSAQELPFQTFNNVYFEGLKPNPQMFKAIKQAKLFISPYTGDGVPLTAIDSVLLGTPVLVRNTEANRATFNWSDECFYSGTVDFAQKIKRFSDMSVTDDEYLRLVEDGIDAIYRTKNIGKSLRELDSIIDERFGHNGIRRT